MPEALEQQPPADHDPLLVWVPRPLRRALRRRAQVLERLERDVVVDLLRHALQTMQPAPRARTHLRVMNNETPALPSQVDAGARGRDGRVRLES